MKYENKFYDALERIFLGAEIEGDSGYVNLLAIKSRYYKNILQIFREQVEAELIISSFKEEFFDRLYSFFEKYFSECGSVYFAKTAFSQNVYEKVYTDNRDVVLFWKTHMLYYVKSDILFKNIDVIVKDDDGTAYKFFFDCGQLKNKQNNEKKELIFTYNKIEDGKYWFDVAYSKQGTKNKTAKIAKSIQVPEEILNKAYSVFKKQNMVDFFINKDAKKFLTEQLDLYLHQILLAENNIFDQNRLDQLKTVKQFALKIIDFVAQFENELVKIWNKPKFVLDSNYVITIDRLPKEIIDKLKSHIGWQEQLAEWEELSINPEGKHAPIDTRFFKSLELEILALFDNLDEVLDGRLIKSENYQALNTMQKRYKEQVQCVYIDPPFNTGKDFEYIDNYQDSSWLTIMYDRLNNIKELLSLDGAMLLHLDYNAEYRGRELLNLVFEQNFINNLAWAYRSGGASDSKALPYKYDNILFYAKDKRSFLLNPVYERQYYTKNFMGAKKDKDGNYYADTLLRDVFEGEILDPKRNITFNVRKVLNLSNEFYSFKNSQKPEGLLHLLLTLSSLKNKKLVLDCFAGSGTALAVAKKMRKKFIGIEMGDYFNTFYLDFIEYKNSESNKKNIYKKFSVIEVEEQKTKLIAKVNKVGLLGRMKEVLACNGRHEPCGITGALNWQGGGFFKYYKFEQYEDTLRKMKYNIETETIFDISGPFANYIFQTDSKLTEVLDIQLSSTSDDSIVNLDFDKLYPNIDFAETISLLKGKPIKKITPTGVLLQGDTNEICTDYKVMTAEEKVEFVKMLKPFLWWGE